ncbi:hypothetical protein H257_14572 [Aphanomyces astaci]|uniref:Vesicle transport protein n=1 Tax=Aphanomyces astaci TaxID=112090 RepID=W4FSU9_APHAT|nr:hypothetical protein H257_14572 [Aphanomyces astaci]ETV69718.1 hypothetical protein H257_14572 [Aphanomyces astaci]|eukprot:XP_009840732.1 hypothetical protein H257_14572 [Aphanomyces astaci]
MIFPVLASIVPMDISAANVRAQWGGGGSGSSLQGSNLTKSLSDATSSFSSWGHSLMKNIPTALTPSSSDAETASLTADDDTDLEHGASPSASSVGMLSLWSNIKSKSQTALSPAQLDNVKSYPQRFRSFVLLLLLAGLFFGMASLFLPLLLLRPSKFALSFSFGSISCLSAVAALRGWKSYCTSLLQAEHILLTTLYLISLGATLYSCLVMGSYLYVLVSAGVQLVTLGYFLVSAFPGGVAAFNTLGKVLMKTAKGISKACAKLMQST